MKFRLAGQILQAWIAKIKCMCHTEIIIGSRPQYVQCSPVKPKGDEKE